MDKSVNDNDEAYEKAREWFVTGNEDLSQCTNAEERRISCLSIAVEYYSVKEERFDELDVIKTASLFEHYVAHGLLPNEM